MTKYYAKEAGLFVARLAWAFTKASAILVVTTLRFVIEYRDRYPALPKPLRPAKPVTPPPPGPGNTVGVDGFTEVEAEAMFAEHARGRGGKASPWITVGGKRTLGRSVSMDDVDDSF
jgi:hypothetical protein